MKVSLQQEVNNLREKLNKLQYQQRASDNHHELQRTARENEQIKANVENCEGKSVV